MSFRLASVPIVTLCDLRGALVWTNYPNPHYQAGTPVWDYASELDRELVKDRSNRSHPGIRNWSSRGVRNRRHEGHVVFADQSPGACRAAA